MLKFIQKLRTRDGTSDKIRLFFLKILIVDNIFSFSVMCNGFFLLLFICVCLGYIIFNVLNSYTLTSSFSNDCFNSFLIYSSYSVLHWLVFFVVNSFWNLNFFNIIAAYLSCFVLQNLFNITYSWFDKIEPFGLFCTLWIGRLFYLAYFLSIHIVNSVFFLFLILNKYHLKR